MITNLLPGFVEFCAAHGVARCPCLATLDKLREAQWQAVERGLPALEQIPVVSPPTYAIAEPSPDEETQVLLSDWCAACGFARAYCKGH
jgi:hypothetical protein